MIILLFFIYLVLSNGGNPITALLSLEKLNGDNFIRWKSNLNMMLICENHKIVMSEECLKSLFPMPQRIFSTNMMHGFNPTIWLSVTYL